MARALHEQQASTPGSTGNNGEDHHVAVLSSGRKKSGIRGWVDGRDEEAFARSKQGGRQEGEQQRMGSGLHRRAMEPLGTRRIALGVRHSTARGKTVCRGRVTVHASRAGGESSVH